MRRGYVERRDGGYYVAGTRVSLDSVVHAFLQGESPESIVECFPSLLLEQVYGAITFYLANQRTVDAYLEREKAHFEQEREMCRRKRPAFYARLERARHSTSSSRR